MQAKLVNLIVDFTWPGSAEQLNSQAQLQPHTLPMHSTYTTKKLKPHAHAISTKPCSRVVLRSDARAEKPT